METDIERRIASTDSQASLTQDKANTMIRENRATK